MVEEQDHRSQVGIQVHSTGCPLKLHDAQSTVAMVTNELQKLEQSSRNERENLHRQSAEHGMEDT